MTTVVVAASGPSLTPEQAALVQRYRDKVRVAVINRTWELLPNADVLYAADRRWWTVYGPQALCEFKGCCWTQDADAAREHGLCRVECKALPGLSRDPEIVHSGSNGGYQIINLVRHFLAPGDRIVLVGFDMQHTDGRKHWHEDYTTRDIGGQKIVFGNAGSVGSWVKNFDRLASDLRDDKIEVLNCSIETALTCFPRADLKTVLEAL